MKNSSRYLLYAVCYGFIAAVLVSCAGKASVKCTVKDAPESDIVVKLLNINQYEILDTVRTDASGRFSYKVDVAKAQPEFIYLFYDDTKIASLLLKRGDTVTVEADTLGTFTVSGSFLAVEREETDFRYDICRSMNSGSTGIPGAIPSRTAPTAGPWLSPKSVTETLSPNVFFMRKTPPLTSNENRKAVFSAFHMFRFPEQKRDSARFRRVFCHE